MSVPATPLTELDVRALRKEHGILPTYHQVDTCAAEFEAYTPYLYSSYEMESEAAYGSAQGDYFGRRANRIGQGIEFDYAAATPLSPCRRWATRPSWSTATPKRSAPTTTPATASTLSR
ncbi:MAG: hypothetical protein R2911_31265 [Caldilineaceae bacterium]